MPEREAARRGPYNVPPSWQSRGGMIGVSGFGFATTLDDLSVPERFFLERGHLPDDSVHAAYKAVLGDRSKAPQHDIKENETFPPYQFAGFAILLEAVRG